LYNNIMNEIMSKEQFLIEHNKLSPVNLQTTFAGLTLFQTTKKPLLKDGNWSLKLRIPLISWMSTLPLVRAKYVRKSTKQEFKNYPETHNV